MKIRKITLSLFVWDYNVNSEIKKIKKSKSYSDNYSKIEVFDLNDVENVEISIIRNREIENAS